MLLNITKMPRNTPESNNNWGKYLIGYTMMLLLGGVWGFASASEITVSGNPGALIINTAIAGSDLAPVTDASTTYGIDITDPNMKITGEIDTAMPSGTSLSVTLGAPTGATSMGQVTLSPTAQNLVTGLDENMVESGMTISYELSASVSAGVVSTGSKTVTFTVTSN